MDSALIQSRFPTAEELRDNFLNGPICKSSKLIKYWRFGMAANPTYSPVVSVFDETGNSKHWEGDSKIYFLTNWTFNLIDQNADFPSLPFIKLTAAAICGSDLHCQVYMYLYVPYVG